MSDQYHVKDPSDVLDYGFNWADWLGADTISTSTWSITPSGTLAVLSESETTTTTTVWLQNGTHGKEYRVTNQITTAGGRTKQLSHVIAVRDQ